jgi:hypothetical protein
VWGLTEKYLLCIIALIRSYAHMLMNLCTHAFMYLSAHGDRGEGVDVAPAERLSSTLSSSHASTFLIN